MKKLYTFLVLIAACFVLSSCNKKEKDNDGGNGGTNYSDSQFVGSYIMWDSENEWLGRIYGIHDSYAALCSARDTYISQGNWELANNIQNEIDMLLNDEEFLDYVDVIDISNGRFRFSTGYLYFNYKSGNNVYKELDCNLAGMNFTVSIVVNDWNVRQYSVGDGGSCLIVKDDYAVSPYVYPTENNKGIIWCECKYYTIDWWFANFR